MTDIQGRIVDQRARNGILDAVGILADGDDAVRSVGYIEYFKNFYDRVDDDGLFLLNTALTPEEAVCVLELAGLVDVASRATADAGGDEGLIASGWPERIRPHARAALDLMLARGRFSEDRAEDEPTP